MAERKATRIIPYENANSSIRLITTQSSRDGSNTCTRTEIVGFLYDPVSLCLEARVRNYLRCVGTCGQSVAADCGRGRTKEGRSGDRRPEMVMVQTVAVSDHCYAQAIYLSWSRGLNLADVLTFIMVSLAQNELCMRSFTFQRFLPFIGAALQNSTHWCFNHMLLLQAT